MFYTETEEQLFLLRSVGYCVGSTIEENNGIYQSWIAVKILL